MYCPSCRSEYRAGIAACKPCGVPLVEVLPAVEMISETDETAAVDSSGGVDAVRAFTYDVASELVRDLEQENIPSVLRALDKALLRDPRPHYQVHVRLADRERAATKLHARWLEIARREAGGQVGATAIEQCPACGAAVPLDAEECPDCGLTVGRATDDEVEDAPSP